MELIITSPQNEAYAANIEFNFDDLKAELETGLKKYENLVYTEDNLKEAGKDRANLNKLAKALDDQRKAVKAKCLEPYEKFAAKINELIDLINAQSGAIDCQIKDFENQYKDEKRAEIQAYYDEVVGDLKALLPLDRIFNAKWLNKGTTLKSVKTEIDGVITKTAEDLKTIDGLETDFAVEVKDTFLRTLDLGEALRRNEYLKSQKAAQEARERAIAQANEARGVEEPEPAKSEPPKIPETPQAEAQAEAEPKHRFEFWVLMDKAQTAALRQFLIDNQIQYGSINHGK